MYSAWLDVVKDFTAIAVGTLAVPIVFYRKVLGVQEGSPMRHQLPLAMVTSWLLIFLSLCASFTYRMGAACHIGEKYVGRGAMSCWVPLQPTFVVMALLYLGGVLLFGYSAARELRRVAVARAQA